MKQRKRNSNPYRGAVSTPGVGHVLWTDEFGINHEHRVTGPADLRLERSQTSRMGQQYKQRRNYEGEYYCASSDQMIWYESMTEYSVLLYLEHTRSPVAVSSQPCCLLFEDNTRHFPDFFMLSGDGSRTLIDVRPVDRIHSKDRHAFMRTGKLCALAGWGYEVCHGVTGWEFHNLELLSAYRISAAAPNREVLSLISSRLGEGAQTLADLSFTLSPTEPWKILPAIYHLMFTRVLSYDGSRPFTMLTHVWKNK